jgi:riboflavin synthase
VFTGLIEDLGSVERVSGSGGYRLIEIRSAELAPTLTLGESISVDGACQTVTKQTDEVFSVETLAVSLRKTTLGELRRGSQVNLETSVTPRTKLGGHFVQGHVDGVARVAKVRQAGKNGYLDVVLPEGLARYCVSEGSIAIAGVSLTVAALTGTRVSVNVIPSTWNNTNLKQLKGGSRVNIETDVIARYVERFAAPYLGAASHLSGASEAGPSEEELP